MALIQILGTGCPKCKKLAENAEAAAKAMGLDYQIEKVTDLGIEKTKGVRATDEQVARLVAKAREVLAKA